MVVNYPNTWLTRSFLALSAHKSNQICNKIQNIWFPLPTYSVLQLPNSVSEKNVVLLNFCLCVYVYDFSDLIFSRNFLGTFRYAVVITISVVVIAISLVCLILRWPKMHVFKHFISMSKQSFYCDTSGQFSNTNSVS